MFNLTHRRHFPVTKGCEEAVGFYKNGSWEFGDDELFLSCEPLIEENECISWSYRSGYKIGEDADGRNLLTMSSNGRFTISEL